MLGRITKSTPPDCFSLAYPSSAPTKQEKGTKLGYALISNRAFVDGNKRIGMYVSLIFLETNGIKIHPTPENVARVGLAVAAGEMNYEELLDRILKNE